MVIPQWQKVQNNCHIILKEQYFNGFSRVSYITSAYYVTVSDRPPHESVYQKNFIRSMKKYHWRLFYPILKNHTIAGWNWIYMYMYSIIRIEDHLKFDRISSSLLIMFCHRVTIQKIFHAVKYLSVNFCYIM